MNSAAFFDNIEFGWAVLFFVASYLGLGPAWLCPLPLRLIEAIASPLTDEPHRRQVSPVATEALGANGVLHAQVFSES
jgi:hypothetical protein